MTRFKIILNLGKDLGTIEYEDENEELFKTKLSTVTELRNTALSILSKQVLAVETREHPIISQPSSTADAILKLLSMAWGKSPRTLNELHSELALNAVHITKEALGSMLTKMVRKGKLGRIKQGKVYAYTLSLSMRTVA